MSRPKVTDERKERLEEIVDEETDLPASALSFDEQLAYLLESYVGRRRRERSLGERVDELEKKLEEAEDASTTSTTSTTGFNR